MLRPTRTFARELSFEPSGTRPPSVGLVMTTEQLVDPIFFRTERLIARPFSDRDAPAALRMYGNEEVTRYLAGMRPLNSIEEQRNHLKRVREKEALWRERYGHPYGLYALAQREDDAIVGAVLIKPLPHVGGGDSPLIEIGWHLDPARWGAGYATEGARGLIAKATGELGITELFAVIEPPNLRSLAVAGRAGMIQLGLTHAYYDGRPMILLALSA